MSQPSRLQSSCFLPKKSKFFSLLSREGLFLPFGRNIFRTLDILKLFLFGNLLYHLQIRCDNYFENFVVIKLEGIYALLLIIMKL